MANINLIPREIKRIIELIESLEYIPVSDKALVSKLKSYLEEAD